MSESAGRPTPGYRYIVQQEDTCRSIAQQAYGDENSWKNVFMANALVIGNNPNRLVVGTELYILVS